jgi:hypothetical protein
MRAGANIALSRERLTRELDAWHLVKKRSGPEPRSGRSASTGPHYSALADCLVGRRSRRAHGCEVQNHRTGIPTSHV